MSGKNIASVLDFALLCPMSMCLPIFWKCCLRLGDRIFISVLVINMLLLKKNASMNLKGMPLDYMGFPTRWLLSALRLPFSGDLKDWYSGAFTVAVRVSRNA